MGFDPISAAFDVGKSIIERVWPDPAQQAVEIRKLEELRQKGDLERMNAHVQLMVGQMEVNKAEAQHPNIFVAGWRPMVGWTAAVSLALAYIPKSLAITSMWVYQNIAVIRATEDMSTFEMLSFPDLGIAEIIGLLTAMLGIGIMRSVDKANGVDSAHTIGQHKKKQPAKTPLMQNFDDEF